MTLNILQNSCLDTVSRAQFTTGFVVLYALSNSIQLNANTTTYSVGCRIGIAIYFLLPETYQPMETLDFYFSMVNPGKANSGSSVNVTVQGCQTGMSLSGWPSVNSNGAPMVEISSPCPSNPTDCSKCNKGQRFLAAAATAPGDDHLAVILLASTAPAILQAFVREESPVSTRRWTVLLDILYTNYCFEQVIAQPNRIYFSFLFNFVLGPGVIRFQNQGFFYQPNNL